MPSKRRTQLIEEIRKLANMSRGGSNPEYLSTRDLLQLKDHLVEIQRYSRGKRNGS